VISEPGNRNDRFWLGELASQRGRMVSSARKRRLRELGYLADGDEPWALTDRGRQFLCGGLPDVEAP
jgi:hypothetical protein